jgi:hypothetical protein
MAPAIRVSDGRPLPSLAPPSAGDARATGTDGGEAAVTVTASRTVFTAGVASTVTPKRSVAACAELKEARSASAIVLASPWLAARTSTVRITDPAETATSTRVMLTLTMLATLVCTRVACASVKSSTLVAATLSTSRAW